MMLKLLEVVRDRLANRAYVNEASISHGIVMPVLNALGWDSADPDQVVPEFAVANGRVDFALLGLARKPVVFVEVKGVGLARDGDRQLFSYAFHHGVPLCVLTDGREWSFYVPAGQGSYSDRRVYRLQLDERSPQECADTFERYLGRSRVRDGSAFEDAQRDHRDAAGRREAAVNLPLAWTELASTPHPQLLELLSERTEALCGFRPTNAEAATFLRRLKVASGAATAAAAAPLAAEQPAIAMVVPPEAEPEDDDAIHYVLLRTARTASSASAALVDILRTITERDPAKIAELADAVQGSSRRLIAPSAAEIYPNHPHLARAAKEIAPGWMVGLNVSNRQKMSIIRAACAIYGLSYPGDLELTLPNA